MPVMRLPEIAVIHRIQSIALEWFKKIPSIIRESASPKMYVSSCISLCFGVFLGVFQHISAYLGIYIFVYLSVFQCIGMYLLVWLCCTGRGPWCALGSALLCLYLWRAWDSALTFQSLHHFMPVEIG